MERRLAAGKCKYYHFENECSRTDTQCWKVRSMVFDAYVIQTVLYGVEVWGGSISSSAWNNIEKLQKAQTLGCQKHHTVCTYALRNGMSVRYML